MIIAQELVRSFHVCNKEKTVNLPERHRTLHSVPSSASLHGTDIVAEEHRQLVESIARHVAHGEYVMSLCLQAHVHKKEIG